MAILKITSWNVEWMAHWFKSDQAAYQTYIEGKQSKGKVADVVGRVAGVLREIDADILCLQEGPKLQSQLEYFLAQELPNTYQVLPTPSRRDQNVWILHKPGVFQSVVTLASDSLVKKDLYDSWKVFYWGKTESLLLEDAAESHSFYRKPVVADFTLGATSLRVVNCHTKSKFIKGGESLWKSTNKQKRLQFVQGSLEDRIKITSEVKALRDYLDHVLDQDPNLNKNVLVCGDLNDGPGRDYFERNYFYHNLVDNLLGTLMYPEYYFYHPFAYLPEADRYTAVFDDFVEEIEDNKIQIDHIVVSPSIFRGSNRIALDQSASQVERQAWINHSATPENEDNDAYVRAQRPSDHRPISVVLNVS